ncbi:MAG: DNA repair protein RecO [Limisphaerales bacterium]
MNESAHGIIVRLRPLSETSLIVHWLTREHGRVATVAKGARKPKSSYHGKLDLFFTADFTFARSRRSDLHNLREVQLGSTHPDLRKKLHKIEQLSYFTNLIEQTTEADTPMVDSFELFAGLVAHLENHVPRPRIVFAFELKHLHELGLAPDIDGSRLSPEAQTTVVDLLEKDWNSIEDLNPTKSVAREIQQFLHGFLIYHIEKLPKGRSVALGLHE